MKHHNKAADPEARITAYAFGELEGEELAAMEAAIAADPSLALRVEELRAFGDEVSAALATEPVPVAPASARGHVVRFPTWAWLAATGLAAAAALAVMVALRVNEPPAERRVAEETVQAPQPVPESAPTPAPSPAPLAAPAAPTQPEPLPAPLKLADDRSGEPEKGEQPEPEAMIAAAPEPAPEAVVPEPAPVAVASIAPVDPRAELRAMIDQGRSRYAAGDLDGAASVFDAVKKLDAGNRQAGYFSARIAQDRGRGTRASSSRVTHGPRLLSVPVSPGAPVSSIARVNPYDPVSSPVQPREAVAEAEFVDARSEPVSTFAADVDTGGYSEIRASILQRRRLPLPNTVRIEELINYFPYDYAPPVAGPDESDAAPFATHLAVASAPWEPEHRLVRIAIKGAELPSELRPAANLVFLVDVSGSMGRPLALVKFALRELLDQLRPDDRVAIVTFEQKSALLLPSTPAARADEIRAAIGRLTPKGGTNGGDGLRRAYAVAGENFQPEGVNRVILCTDGMFNVGVTGREELLSLIREEAGRRVYLTALGFGFSPGRFILAGPRGGPRGNNTLEMLADNGNGVYGFVDSAPEARKILVEQVSGTLATIAKDVKIQVAFNPERVASYRLIGYENRALTKAAFEDEAADAGEIGAGHAVTALYEIVPAGKAARRRSSAPTQGGTSAGDELLMVKIRHQTPEGAAGPPLEFMLSDGGGEFEDADDDFRFAAAVAAWGMLLREGGRSNLMDLADVQGWAEKSLGADAGGYRSEFVELVKRSRGRGR